MFTIIVVKRPCKEQTDLMGPPGVTILFFIVMRHSHLIGMEIPERV